jgi:tRNA pseudouridine32 synthase/23S rRNA pseudouridine746 synthase
VIVFDPQPTELPDRFASPFVGDPPALARRAADELRERVRGLGVELDAPDGGKMFGVLVVASRAGRVGYLQAFSGMLGGSWYVEGFAPPTFDAVARDAVWPAGEAELAGIARRIRELDVAIEPVRAELAVIAARHEAASGELATVHAANRQSRHAARAAAGERHELDQQSRGDTAERKRLLAAQRAERGGLDEELRRLDDERTALDRLRTERSRVFLVQIHDTYVLANARGERRSLRELFAPDAPPGGSGDCAAPKLFAQAYREGLRPIAIAEVWLGAPPATGGRHAGVFYPACRGKCGPILAHMLDGLDAEPAPVFGNTPIAADEPRVVFEDRWLVIVDKPCGLLSVPGRSGLLRDSVQTRLRVHYPDALLVHRLDLDASGLLLVAKGPDTYAMLQALFARREGGTLPALASLDLLAVGGAKAPGIDKRYIAWLDGTVAGDHGVIELALRVDVDDRPRQIYDPVHGKHAITEWRVLERTPARTRVALHPRTGRTHQLRVHASHPLGLAAPIAGDRLYGHDGPRLLLHAEALAFTHPHTGERLELELLAPF